MQYRIILPLFLFLASFGFAEGRLALVIGNSSYASNALSNPVNDAKDMAALLKECGFEVLLKTDADYASMDQSLDEFQKRLKGKDTALFYYAGHGVQAEGENYLIPVKEDISSLAKARSRGVPLGDVLARIKEAQVQTALVFLDACRDNPFPGATRSGTRGLSVVAVPADVETLIAYATQPGQVAQDGKGRNGVFTAALLKNIATPGKTVGEVMIQVKADVKAATGGEQQPRIDDGLSQSFYFNDPVQAAARAQSASAKSQSELAALDQQLILLKAKIQASKSAKDRQALQVEQQRQEALQAAKKLEAENLAKEADRQKQLAAQAQQVALQRQSVAQEAQAKQNELGTLAAARRAEMEKLALAGAADNPEALIETIEKLDAVLKEIDGQYAAALAKGLAGINATWDKQRDAAEAEKPKITETDDEFAARRTKDRNSLEAKRQAELNQLKASTDKQRLTQTASIRQQLTTAVNTLQSKVWTNAGRSVSLTPGEFDRNTRKWPLTIQSNDPLVPFGPWDMVVDLNRSAKTDEAILAMDTAVKANALTASINWSVRRNMTSGRYSLIVKDIRVTDLTRGTETRVDLDKRMAWFGKKGRTDSLVLSGPYEGKIQSLQARKKNLASQLEKERARDKSPPNWAQAAFGPGLVGGIGVVFLIGSTSTKAPTADDTMTSAEKRTTGLVLLAGGGVWMAWETFQGVTKTIDRAPFLENELQSVSDELSLYE